MKSLKEAADSAGRLNNFNLIRITAAFSVLLSHSFTLATGDSSLEPFRSSAGFSLGSLAVLVFFLTSGYLVGGSLQLRADPLRFLMARALRIFPALLLAMTLTVLVAGPLLSELPAGEFWADHQTWRYWLTNCIAVTGNDNHLPGMFASVPFVGTVNGSLWSITYELWMYGLLLAVWLATRAGPLRGRFGAAVAALVVLATFAFWLHGAREPGGGDVIGKASWLIPAFFTGVGMHLLRARIPLQGRIAIGALSLLVVTACIGSKAFAAVDILCLAYLVIYVAYCVPVARPFLHADYSYGIYLYSFLVQQSLALLIPGIGILAMTINSAWISLVLAAASWHGIEQRAARLAGPIARRLRRPVADPMSRSFPPSMNFPSRLDAEG